MKAVVYDEYGSPDNLELREIPDPVCGPGECLVRVRAAAVNPADWRVLEGKWKWITGRRFPRKIGIDFAGTVVRAGERAGRFNPGDAVIGSVSYLKNGTFAEYVAAPEAGICRKPANLDFADCAGIPVAATTASLGLTHRHAGLAGRRVLVNGAGGGVGHVAVQLARHMGAAVTAVCSTAKVAMAAELGADPILDYTEIERDGRRVVEALAECGGFDVVFDCARSLAPEAVQRILSSEGEALLLSTEGKIGKFLLAGLSQLRRGKRTWAVLAHPDGRRLEGLVPLFEDGTLHLVVGSRYPLERAADALREGMRGHATGKIVIEVQGES